ncbi:hypothetical protein C487_17690 [Natrinema pallidum DSM 3751]|uniref:Uncharacterized protein n=2 Tax=Natrinema pallidum TaxID=69527 RepID=L9YJZ7_9EURY|nr:hypothetical protein C487_17690 [Natrinema pallidum DSM 3751]
MFFDPEGGIHIYTEFFGTHDLCPDCAREFEQWFVEGAPDGTFHGQERYDPEESTHHWPDRSETNE